jgi:inner membrane protein
MDSLSQMVLGAGVAEIALGKKIGNRAMVWGAIAGTIPDLDVLANGFMSPVGALAFHRGITHSLLVNVILALILGFVIHHFYQRPWQKWVAVGSWSLMVIGISGSMAFLGDWSTIKLLIALGVLSFGGYSIYKRYFNEYYTKPDASVKQWQWLFLLSLVTHPILDCFTTYGTQILLPFSNMRVAFNNIAVADPLYTLPFLVCLIAAAVYPKTHARRRFWIRSGLAVSSLYMAFTIFNKTRINTIFDSTLIKEKIEYSRYMTTPTILNNVLWSGIAETDTGYVYGMYSFFDAEKTFKLNVISKNRKDFIVALENDSTLKTLRWFSDDFFQMKQVGENKFEYYDLRFGTFRMKASDPDQFVFKFNIEKSELGDFILKDQGDRPRDANFAEAFEGLWNRIMGRI